ncbi:protein kinase [Blastococcus sp. TF02A-26]|uniref:protein kinase domain-containing protein n=1 Tax=Blastococcus sp. TF02A-26 TaxID=2250577 RepID=UPI000DE80722|nr:protein kinase [Blastococcus sp. TF02A-26]RBY79009.1 serine/threonine protein kinase [Blastococcus sp. TF02A-26]
MELRAGSRVGGYELVRPLGEGGMGSVWLAHHPNLPRDVALKVLHPDLARTPDQRARFSREAEMVCRLSHPNVVDVIDRGQDGDRLWMSMQYVPGEDLASRLQRAGAAPPAEAVRIVAAVAAALDHAHSRGLLHRDVKPANVLLSPQPDGPERVLLADFGIARGMEGSGQLTSTGQVVASFSYASPEQVSGRQLDPRTDVYSLAAVLFELLTGRRLFDTDDPIALMWQVVNAPTPDLRSLRPDLPPRLAEVLARGLAKDPEQRYRSCGLFAAAVRDALAPGPAPTRQQPPPPPAPLPLTPARPRRRTWVWALASALVVLLLAGAAVLVVVLVGREDDDPAVPPPEGETVPAAEVAATVERQTEDQEGVGVAVTCDTDLAVAAGESVRCELEEDGTGAVYGLTVTSAGPEYDEFEWQVDDEPVD